MAASSRASTTSPRGYLGGFVLQTRALVEQAAFSAPWINGLVSAVLLALASLLVIYAVRAWRVPASRPDVETI